MLYQKGNAMKHLLLSSASAVVALTVASPAFAGTITLDFGSLVNTATDAQIQSYIDGLLPSGDSVVVTGAAGSCNTSPFTCPYSADGHIVGPTSGFNVTSYTLTNKDGGSFIGTGGDFVVSGANQITMTFSGPDFTGSNALKNIAFDFEIFPDNSCTSLTGNNCGGNGNPDTPDLKVSAGSTLIATYLAGTPTSPGYVHSPDTGIFSNETAPQEIGSASLSIPAGTTELTFADWPAAIGIDNLVLTTGQCTPGTSGCSTDTPVPEPGTMPLLGAFVALGGLAFGRRSFKQIHPTSAYAPR
jgi:hypothetical protein